MHKKLKAKLGHGAKNPEHQAKQLRAASEDDSQETDKPVNVEPELGGYPDSQAKRVIQKFGGVRCLREALRAVGYVRSLQSIYYWLKEGLIPPAGVRQILATPKAMEITDSDWSPVNRVPLQANPAATVTVFVPTGWRL